MDQRGIIVHCNPSTERIFGFACDELIGRPIDGLLVERRSNGGEGGFHALVGEGEHLVGRTIELTGRRKDGEQIPLEMCPSSNVQTGAAASISEHPIHHLDRLGFCVTVEHARYMARVFAEAGIAAKAVWADTPEDERANALRDLRERKVI